MLGVMDLVLCHLHFVLHSASHTTGYRIARIDLHEVKEEIARPHRPEEQTAGAWLRQTGNAGGGDLPAGLCRGAEDGRGRAQLPV